MKKLITISILALVVGCGSPKQASVVVQPVAAPAPAPQPVDEVSDFSVSIPVPQTTVIETGVAQTLDDQNQQVIGIPITYTAAPGWTGTISTSATASFVDGLGKTYALVPYYPGSVLSPGTWTGGSFQLPAAGSDTKVVIAYFYYGLAVPGTYSVVAYGEEVGNNPEQFSATAQILVTAAH
jgi:hypothetical protein